MNRNEVIAGLKEECENVLTKISASDDRIAEAEGKITEVRERVEELKDKHEELIRQMRGLGIQFEGEAKTTLEDEYEKLSKSIKKLNNDMMSMKARVLVHDKDQRKFARELHNRIAKTRNDLQGKEEYHTITT
eukprot:TRINITY_DN3938_c0_g1_i1.p2 TRINITY_DN3938_c0_g1~~TRINITY_DN3938_c0_g1_i1.p2  ORF type:complete len:133 (-),score=28.73 TRINITY_DN3938_c0_g1_i1:335-733(-)